MDIVIEEKFTSDEYTIIAPRAVSAVQMHPNSKTGLGKSLKLERAGSSWTCPVSHS